MSIIVDDIQYLRVGLFLSFPWNSSDLKISKATVEKGKKNSKSHKNGKVCGFRKRRTIKCHSTMNFYDTWGSSHPRWTEIVLTLFFMLQSCRLRELKLTRCGAVFLLHIKKFVSTPKNQKRRAKKNHKNWPEEKITSKRDRWYCVWTWSMVECSGRRWLCCFPFNFRWFFMCTHIHNSES